MRYIFPRQFGLHNVFTSKVDSRETAMPFKDYTLREKDIHSSMCRELGNKATNTADIARWKSRTPKRLRGSVVVLVKKLRTLNQRCSYMELLRHYCPVEVFSVTSGNSGFTNAIRAYPCSPSQSGGRAHCNRRQTYVQPQTRISVIITTVLRLNVARSSKYLSPIWRVTQHMCRLSAVLLSPRSYLMASGAVTKTSILSCTG
jgi:hypothetical protein